MNMYHDNKGFTLVELLIVISLIAILSTITYVSVNPAARFQEARNARRQTDVSQIFSAIKLHQAEHKGSILDVIASKEVGVYYMIGDGSADCTTSCIAPEIITSPTCIDLSELVTGGFMPSQLEDPETGTPSVTGYYLIKNSNNTITVGTCQEELGSGEAIHDISVTK